MQPLFDRKVFYDTVRPIFPKKKLTIAQVAGMNVKLDLWEDTCRELDLRWLANMLAQNKWETGARMEPIKEMGGDAYLTKNYDVRGSNPKRARENGNVNPGDGVKYCGRGDIQITWFNNYLYFEKLLNVPLTKQPDLALHPYFSAQIMFIGMLGGHFTGRRLSHYFGPGIDDPFNARSIVNGDKNYKKQGSTVGALIEKDHRVFFTALTQAAR